MHTDGPDGMQIADHIVGLFHTFAQVNMAWWVSATALIGSLLGGVWLKRDRLAEAGKVAVHAVCTLGAFFIGSVVGYGILMIYAARGLRNDLHLACAETGAACAERLDAFFEVAPVALMIGTSSFVISLALWFGMWVRISREISRHDAPESVTADSPSGEVHANP
jgi:hypothetical protein